MKTDIVMIKLEKKFTDITKEVNKHLVGVKNGFVIISSMHTTCGVKIMENEILSLSDIDDFLKRVAPEDIVYAHDKIDLRQVPLTERINGYSHVRMLFFDSSITVPVSDEKLMLGEWQSIMAVEMDGLPPRKRKFVIQVIEA